MKITKLILILILILSLFLGISYITHAATSSANQQKGFLSNAWSLITGQNKQNTKTTPQGPDPIAVILNTLGNGHYDLGTFASFYTGDFVKRLIRLSVILATLLFTISIFLEMYKGVIDKGGGTAYLKLIVQIWVIFMCINYYGYIINYSLSIVDHFPDTYGLSENINSIIAKSKNKQTHDMNVNTDNKESLSQNSSQKPKEQAWWDSLKEFCMNLTPENILVAIVWFIAQAIIIIISALRNIYLTLLIIMGPVMIAMFANSTTREYGQGWIKSFINIASWPIWMSLIVWIQNGLIQYQLSSSSGGSKIIIFSYNVVFILVLLQVPTFLPTLLSGKGSGVSPTGLALGAAFAGAKMMQAATPIAQTGMKRLWNASNQQPTIASALDPLGIQRSMQTGIFNRARVPTKPYFANKEQERLTIEGTKARNENAINSDFFIRRGNENES